MRLMPGIPLRIVRSLPFRSSVPARECAELSITMLVASTSQRENLVMTNSFGS
jgi:hypothetical protein